VGNTSERHIKASIQPPSSPVVEVATVEQKNIPVYGEWIGTLTGQVNADVKAQVTGYLLTRKYKEGSYVKKGQLLFEIDPRPFQAALGIRFAGARSIPSHRTH
jgi:multidrug efflux pump subunit AcrA (membrane-fusion protein)